MGYGIIIPSCRQGLPSSFLDSLSCPVRLEGMEVNKSWFDCNSIGLVSSPESAFDDLWTYLSVPKKKNCAKQKLDDNDDQR